MKIANRTLIGRSAIITATQLTARLLNLATLSVVLKLVGNAEFGKFQYYLSLAMTALTFGSAGVDGVLNREISLGIRHACNWLYHGLVLRMGTVGLALLALFAVAWTTRMQVNYLLLFGTSLLAFSESLLIFGSGWYRARRLPLADLGLNLARGLAILISICVILRLVPDERGITLSYTIGAGLVLAHTVWQWRRQLSVGRRQSFSYRALWAPWATFFTLDVLGNIHGQLPTLFLGGGGRFEEVALFTVYNKFLSPAALITGSYLQAFFPEFNRMLRRGDDVRAFTRHGLSMIGWTGLASGFAVVVIAPFVIRWLGHQPVVDWRLVAAYAAMPLVAGFSAAFDNMLAAMHKERALLWSHGAADLSLVIALLAGSTTTAVYASIAMLTTIAVKAVIAGSIFYSQSHTLRGSQPPVISANPT